MNHEQNNSSITVFDQSPRGPKNSAAFHSDRLVLGNITPEIKGKSTESLLKFKSHFISELQIIDLIDFFPHKLSFILLLCVCWTENFKRAEDFEALNVNVLDSVAHFYSLFEICWMTRGICFYHRFFFMYD